VLAGTKESLQQIRDRVGGISVDEVGKRLTVSQRDDTSYLDFTYRAGSAKDAELGANAAMEVYIEAARAAAQDRLDEQSDLLTQLIADAPEWEQADLQQQKLSLERTVIDPGEVAQSATDNAERATVDLTAFPIAGALGGLLLAAAAAYLLEVLVPKVRADRHSGLPVRALGRLDESGRALIPVAGRLESVALPEDQPKPKVGVAVLSSRGGDVVGSVKRALRAHLQSRKVKTVPLDLSTGTGIEAARNVDGLLLVAVEGHTRLKQLEDLLRHLELLGIEPMGLLTVPRRWAWSR
jgi:hypothetical protein